MSTIESLAFRLDMLADWVSGVGMCDVCTTSSDQSSEGMRTYTKPAVSVSRKYHDRYCLALDSTSPRLCEEDGIAGDEKVSRRGLGSPHTRCEITRHGNCRFCQITYDHPAFCIQKQHIPAKTATRSGPRHSSRLCDYEGHRAGRDPDDGSPSSSVANGPHDDHRGDDGIRGAVEGFIGGISAQRCSNWLASDQNHYVHAAIESDLAFHHFCV